VRNEPTACVIGDLSLIRPLGEAGVPVVAVVGDPHDVVVRSRYVVETLVVPDPVDRPEQAVAELIRYGAGRPAPPVLYYQGDHDLLMVSRWREALAPYFRLLLPDPVLVEDLVDKLRFAALAERLELPVPLTRTIVRGPGFQARLREWDRFPCIIKPATRAHWFDSRLHREVIRSSQKVIRADTRRRLEELTPLLAAHETDFVIQEAIEGGEERILSYHAYVRPDGEVVGEFTGRKIRTLPRTFGLSSCVEITDEASVMKLGREVLERLRFHGVVKLDFKQEAETERVCLFEVNPRYSLWHHPGAVAGVNIPFLVYRDLVHPESTWPTVARARPGVRWMCLRHDLRALPQYRAAGEITVAAWLRQLLTCDVVEELSWKDFLPGLMGGMAALKALARAVLGKVVRRPGRRGNPESA